MRLTRMIATALAGAALTVGSLAQPGVAADRPYLRGPHPTHTSIEATLGSFAVTSKTIARRDADGFGGGTIWYPRSTASGRFGVVAVSPGLGASQSKIAWLGPRLASQGFVVITIETNTLLDGAPSRGRQLLAAIDQAVADPTAGPRIDASRQAVIGSSMGGGGTLEAAKARPGLEARIGLVPFNSDKTWPEVEAASLEIGAEDDMVAAPKNHAIPFYESLWNAERRAYLELRGEDHFVSRDPNTTVAKYSIAWLKWFVDNDTRYRSFFEPGPDPLRSGEISDYRID